MFTARSPAGGWVGFTGLLPRDYQVRVTGWTSEDQTPAIVSVLGTETATAYLGVLPKGATSAPTSASPSPSASATAVASASTSAPASVSSSSGPVLAVTGSSSGPLFGAGLAVIVAGALAFVLTRRRRRRFALPD